MDVCTFYQSFDLLFTISCPKGCVDVLEMIGVGESVGSSYLIDLDGML